MRVRACVCELARVIVCRPMPTCVCVDVCMCVHTIIIITSRIAHDGDRSRSV